MKVKMESNFKAVQMVLEAAGKQEIRVGFFETAQYADGKPVAYIASIQEFGYAEGSIPPRPFMRTTETEKKVEWGNNIAGALADAIARKSSTVLIDNLNQVGGAAAGDIKQTIAKIQAPPLSPITIELRRVRKAGGKVTGGTVGEAAKASSSAFWKPAGGTEGKPLVDTGILISSVTWDVVLKGSKK